MKKLPHLLLLTTVLIFSCKNDKNNASVDNSSNSEYQKKLEIIPISHATMVLNYGDETIYVDPTGGKLAFKNQKKPTIVLITDVHGDHYNLKTLKEIDLNGTVIVAPKAVVDKFPEDFKPMFKVLNNGESSVIKDITIEAIPMYNLREEALKFHPKGRGNGYVLTFENERIYISGDTEDIPEMRDLKNIDKAFICMNLPYTMPVESAANAVLEFKPKQVYPYHYRGTGGLSDIRKFRSIVEKGNLEVEVVQLNWYPNL